MIIRSVDEIDTFFKDAFKSEYGEVPTVYIRFGTDYHQREFVIVEVKNSDSMVLNLKKLIKLSEFFGTTNIDEVEQHKSGGCHTCDYGASYSLTFTIHPDIEGQEAEWHINDRF